MTLKNLGRLHESIRSDVEIYCGKLVTVLGSNLRSIAVYGSATGPDFIPGKSNVNLVLVLGRLNQDVLTSLLETVKWGFKKRIVPPLLITTDYIDSSLDVFPIEFMEIRDSQVVLTGDDFFSSLKISQDHLRLECESQLKAAVLRTRQAYLEVGLSKKGAESVLHASLTSLIPVFKAMLRLKGVDVPKSKIEVAKAMGETFVVGTRPFVAILQDKAGDEKIDGKEAHQILAAYIADITNLSNKVDQL